MKKSTIIWIVIAGVILIGGGFAAYYYWGVYLPKKKTAPPVPGAKIADLVITPTPPSPTTIKTAAPAPAVS